MHLNDVLMIICDSACFRALKEICFFAANLSIFLGILIAWSMAVVLIIKIIKKLYLKKGA